MDNGYWIIKSQGNIDFSNFILVMIQIHVYFYQDKTGTSFLKRKHGGNMYTGKESVIYMFDSLTVICNLVYFRT